MSEEKVSLPASSPSPLEDASAAAAPATKRRKLEGEDDTITTNGSTIQESEAANLLSGFTSSTAEAAKTAAAPSPAPAKIGSGSFVPFAGPLSGSNVRVSLLGTQVGVLS
jgi:hypothetical protein